MQATFVFLGLLALAAPLVRGAAVPCRDNQFQCRDGSCTNSLADKCDGVKTCKDGSDEDAAICNGIPSTPFKLDDAEHTSVVRSTYATEHKGIVLLVCEKEKCNKVEVNGSNQDGALSYTFYDECNSLGGGPCRLNRTVSATGSTPLKAGPVVIHVMRLPKRLAIFLEGHMKKAVVLPAPMCANKLKIKPLVWKSNMPVTITKKDVEEYEKEGQAGEFEGPSSADIIADTIAEAFACTLMES